MSEEDDTPRRPLGQRKESKVRKLIAYLKIASDVGAIVMDLRDKPSRMDWFSMGLRAANTGIGWYQDRKRVSITHSPWEYFNENDEWSPFPNEYAKMVLAGAQDLQVAEEFVDSDVKLPYACIAKLGKETIGWTVDAGQVTDGPFYREDREGPTFEALGTMLWRVLGGKQLLYSTSGLVVDAYHDEGIIPTEQMKSLLDRMTKFLVAEEPRGYLLGGVPGTGKSITIRWLAGVLGLSSIRVDLRLLAGESDRRGSSIVVGLETMLKALKPDMMILDDLDRIEVDASVLQFLELARQSCRIVIASANSISELSGAAIRPGRFDDIITFEKLDREVIIRILGPGNADLVDMVLDLPAAYVAEFARRCKVLGRDQAITDLPELIERAQETSEDAD
jgi:hypothetical protein